MALAVGKDVEDGLGAFLSVDFEEHPLTIVGVNRRIQASSEPSTASSGAIPRIAFHWRE